MKGFSSFVFTYRGAIAPLAILPVFLSPLAGEGRWAIPVGLVLLIAGTMIRVAGVRHLGGRARIHSAGARILRTSGIYSATRHPLYEGNILVAGGLAAVLGSLLGALLALGLAGCLYTIVAAYEEACLKEQVGDQYRRYCRTVPRWGFPLRAPGRAGKLMCLEPWARVLHHERWFLLAIHSLLLAGLIRGVFPSQYAGLLDTGVRLALVSTTVLVSIILFARIARHLQRRRGTWLAVQRVSPVAGMRIRNSLSRHHTGTRQAGKPGEKEVAAIHRE